MHDTRSQYGCFRFQIPLHADIKMFKVFAKSIREQTTPH